MRDRFAAWFHRTFDDWFFRSFIGPAQTKGAIHGADQVAREHWKQDLERRKQYTREQRALRR
ncbi:hypothetical protein [Actinoplanes sp. NBRC 103695]|uniref:hypothetical protein n=1 Tax=Actinoplanes sp. NBRC 103695 TaxID=3032202 RepID=UPI0024A1AB06|nr:hypothetical protein [Actinoplanes sp. NBRC 103695]GLY97474.1 hypothetical protein Acsp02_47280 [Actinoplanes sp. NBRC 103695]